MMPETQLLLSWLAAGLCLLCGVAAFVLRPGHLSGALFFSGMVLLAGECWLEGRAETGVEGEEFANLVRASTLLKSLIPGVWLAFGLVYGRGDPAGLPRLWKWAVAAAILVPMALWIGFPEGSLQIVRDDGLVVVRLQPAGMAWATTSLLVTVVILINLEKTFRGSVGLIRWRIKYLILGIALIMGVRLYESSQLLLFSVYRPENADFARLSVLLGCPVIGLGLSRGCFGKFEIYPSRTVLQGSVTLVLIGGYFVIIGLAARVADRFGGLSGLPLKSLVLLFGAMCLAVILLSENVRTTLQRLISRHFRRPEHDFRKIWTDFTRRTSSVLDAASLGKGAAEVVSENFHAMGVSVFRTTADANGLVLLHSTGRCEADALSARDVPGLADVASHGHPANLERSPAKWAAVLRDLCPSQFQNGGERMVVPLVGGERLVGVMVLSDRVNGVPYGHEEKDLLKCIGDQLGGALLNVALAEEVLQARELEAFQTFSTFLVHDLKNAANSLGLMLQNLPEHFDDPEFRADAINVVAGAAGRINNLILRLGDLRRGCMLHPEPCRLDELCAEVLESAGGDGSPGIRLEMDLKPLPVQFLDPDAIRSVVTNLLSNARESLGETGLVKIGTRLEEGNALLVVSDDGCGMSQEFIRSRLFRPFESTKSRGLGIGMYQCLKIVEAHRGSIRVESVPGGGTCFSIRLPVVAEAESSKESP